MIKIHTDNGETLTLDLSKEDEAARWQELLRSPTFQESITGVTLLEEYAPKSSRFGVQYSVPRPRNVRNVHYALEHVPASGRVKGGERVILFADDVRLVVMAHAAQPAGRISLSKVGKRVGFPPTKG